MWVCVFIYRKPNLLPCRCMYEGLLTALGALARYGCSIMTLSLILRLGQIKNNTQTVSVLVYAYMEIAGCWHQYIARSTFFSIY